MNKLKDPNGVYQDYLQSGSFKFGPGDVKYTDLDGDGKISNGDGTVENPGDKEIIGNDKPRFEYGIRLGADYKGFDFSIFMQGVGKRQIWGDGFLAIPATTLLTELCLKHLAIIGLKKTREHSTHVHGTKPVQTMLITIISNHVTYWICPISVSRISPLDIRFRKTSSRKYTCKKRVFTLLWKISSHSTT